MSRFFLWGLICGAAFMAAYILISIFRRKTPQLSHGIELLVSGSGLLGGLKLCWLVFDGELSRMIQTAPASALAGIGYEDAVYFLVGGVALGWLSLETVIKRLRATLSSEAGNAP